jgi:hypothetical protein
MLRQGGKRRDLPDQITIKVASGAKTPGHLAKR